MEPEPEAVYMQRAPIAAPSDGSKPDLLQQLQVQQLERMQLAIQFLTSPGVRSQPKERKVVYLKKQLHVSEAEVEEAFKRAQETLIQPAIDFLSHEKVCAQPIGRRVSYLRQKLGLNDIDIEEAFQRIGDHDAAPFFKATRISAAVTFLTNPALKNRPGDAKVKYLKAKLGLSDEEVKVCCPLSHATGAHPGMTRGVQESFRKVIEVEMRSKMAQQAKAGVEGNREGAQTDSGSEAQVYADATRTMTVSQLQGDDALPVLQFYTPDRIDNQVINFYR